MSWIAKAGLAAALLNCGLSNASAEEPAKGQWLKDGACAVLSADAQPGDTVKWTGSCVDGYAEGLGTATFTHDGKDQSFTANFTHGVIPDGHVITRWGPGWSYEGETVAGRFNGLGVLTTDANDRFEGQWAAGKMTGFGVMLRANGERYTGNWKDDKPNGTGELRLADGRVLAGSFVDGKLTKEDGAVATMTTASAPDLPSPAPGIGSGAPFGGVSGKTLTGVDGSSAALNLIEGGMELQVVPVNANTRKVTFTFMTDRMGTVVEDNGNSNAGSSVTGFFRLTDQGMEIHYSDGRSAMLSANLDGGLQLAQGNDAGASCRTWYPPGHVFSDGEKKMALNAYAEKLGLPVTAGEAGNGCSPAPKPHAANQGATGGFTRASINPAITSRPRAAVSRLRPERQVAAKSPERMKKDSYRIGDYKPLNIPETVEVRTSEVHSLDLPVASSANQKSAIVVPSIGAAMAAPAISGDKNDASRCLKVDSDGVHWGFRNGCDFAVQFAYCMAGSGDSLTACGKDVTVSAVGSVAANGFGALMADNSLKEQDAAHNFRWVACGGGAGEVVAHLDHSEPPAGRCERSRTASAN